MRCGGNWFTVLCAGHLAELRRHSESGRDRHRLIGRKRLLLGFTFSLNRSLECHTGSLLT